jgi:hypothetical protein
MSAARSSKLAELRAKTDQDLVSLIDDALQVGLLLSAGEPDGDRADVLHHRAAHIYTDTMMLVEKVENARERWRLEEELREFRQNLERRHMQTASA